MRVSFSKGRGQMMLKLAVGVVAAGFAFAGSARAATPPAATVANDQFFDWFVNTTPSYVPSPFLTNNNAGSVNAFLQQMPAGAIRAVKIEKPINQATANLIFNNSSYHVSYVLGDIEGANAAADMKNLAQQVRFV